MDAKITIKSKEAVLMSTPDGCFNASKVDIKINSETYDTLREEAIIILTDIIVIDSDIMLPVKQFDFEYDTFRCISDLINMLRNGTNISCGEPVNFSVKNGKCSAKIKFK